MEEYKNARFITDYELNRNRLLKQVEKLLGEFSNRIDFGTQDAEIKLKILMQQIQIKAKMVTKLGDYNWSSYN